MGQAGVKSVGWEGMAAKKFETRNSKFEGSSKSEIRNSTLSHPRSRFRLSNLFRLSDFEFRISCASRCFHTVPPMSVIGRARTLARHHGRAERMLRGAARAERGAL